MKMVSNIHRHRRMDGTQSLYTFVIISDNDINIVGYLLTCFSFP